MRIAVLGAGAMGSLFGGYLSQHSEVWLVDVDPEKINIINSDGIKIREPQGDLVFRPKTLTDTAGLGPVHEFVVELVHAMEDKVKR